MVRKEKAEAKAKEKAKEKAKSKKEDEDDEEHEDGNQLNDWSWENGEDEYDENDDEWAAL